MRKECQRTTALGAGQAVAIDKIAGTSRAEASQASGACRGARGHCDGRAIDDRRGWHDGRVPRRNSAPPATNQGLKRTVDLHAGECIGPAAHMVVCGERIGLARQAALRPNEQMAPRHIRRVFGHPLDDNSEAHAQRERALAIALLVKPATSAPTRSQRAKCTANRRGQPTHKPRRTPRGVRVRA